MVSMCIVCVYHNFVALTAAAVATKTKPPFLDSLNQTFLLIWNPTNKINSSFTSRQWLTPCARCMLIPFYRSNFFTSCSFFLQTYRVVFTCNWLDIKGPNLLNALIIWSQNLFPFLNADYWNENEWMNVCCVMLFCRTPIELWPITICQNIDVTKTGLLCNWRPVSVLMNWPLLKPNTDWS